MCYSIFYVLPNQGNTYPIFAKSENKLTLKKDSRIRDVMSTREYWENEARNRLTFSLRHELFEDYWTKRYLMNIKHLKCGKAIIDIGCGNAKYFIKLTDKFSEFYGVELSRFHFEPSSIIFPLANYAVSDAHRLPFQDSSFNAIVSFGAFEHNEDITSIFRECYRILGKNGILLFSVPNYISLYFPYLYINRCILKKRRRIDAIGHNYSNRQLFSKLREQGFRKVEMIDSIFAAPLPINFAGLVTKIVNRSFKTQSYTNPDIRERDRNLNDRNEKVRERISKLDYFLLKSFYPLERNGLGFMKVIYCQK
jgi:SAM-dependent methyltransferase